MVTLKLENSIYLHKLLPCSMVTPRSVASVSKCFLFTQRVIFKNLFKTFFLKASTEQTTFPIFKNENQIKNSVEKYLNTK